LLPAEKTIFYFRSRSFGFVTHAKGKKAKKKGKIKGDSPKAPQNYE